MNWPWKKPEPSPKHFLLHMVEITMTNGDVVVGETGLHPSYLLLENFPAFIAATAEITPPTITAVNVNPAQIVHIRLLSTRAI